MDPYYNVKITKELETLLQEIDTLKEKIATERAKSNGQLSQLIQDRLRFLWTYNSNAIEGSKLTLGDTIFFLQEGLTVQGKPFKDFLDAKNHADAISYLEEYVKGDYPINSQMIRSLNSLLLKGVESIPGKDAAGNLIERPLKAGEYKTEQNYVLQPDGTIHEYVEPYLVGVQLNDLCDWIEENSGTQHAIVMAAIAHYNMVRIHPFQDGNGRGARLLMNIILMRQKYNPAIVEVTKRRAYLESLKAADQGDLIPFIQFIAESVDQTQKEVYSEIVKYQKAKQTPDR